MKLDTMGPLVDVQPMYEALAELTANDDLLSPAQRTFLLGKLKETIHSLRSTAVKELEGAWRR